MCTKYMLTNRNHVIVQIAREIQQNQAEISFTIRLNIHIKLKKILHLSIHCEFTFSFLLKGVGERIKMFLIFTHMRGYATIKTYC